MLKCGGHIALSLPQRQATYTPAFGAETCSGRATAESYVKTECAEVGQSEADRAQSYNASVTHGLMQKSWTMTAANEVAKGACITRMPVGRSVSICGRMHRPKS